MLLEIFVPFARRRCMLQSYCGANISSVKIVFQNGNSYIPLGYFVHLADSNFVWWFVCLWILFHFIYFPAIVQIGNREYRKYFLFTLLPSLVCVTYVLIILVLVTLSGLKEKGLALYAGPWLGQLIYGHLGTDQQACLSRCSKFYFFFLPCLVCGREDTTVLW